MLLFRTIDPRSLRNLRQATEEKGRSVYMFLLSSSCKWFDGAFLRSFAREDNRHPDRSRYGMRLLARDQRRCSPLTPDIPIDFGRDIV